MTKENLKYIKDTLDWINDNTDLKNHDEGIETYSNLMMNCENIIAEELALLGVSKWLSFNDNIDLFNDADNSKLLCKFDDGTVCKYMEQIPMAIMTHFKIL